jgi:hypothetical protein
MSGKKTTFDRYTGQPQAESIEELDASPDEATVSALESTNRFENVVHLNDEGPFVLGEGAWEGTATLYHRPSDGGAVAGQLHHATDYKLTGENGSGMETTHTIGYEPKTESDESPVYAVSSLEVEECQGFKTLSTIFDHLREELTDSTWVDEERPDTSYPEWMDACSELQEYAYTTLGDDDVALTSEIIKAPRVYHTVARYPVPADRALSQVASVCAEQDPNMEQATPIGFLALLLRYSRQHLDCRAVSPESA